MISIGSSARRLGKDSGVCRLDAVLKFLTAQGAGGVPHNLRVTIYSGVQGEYMHTGQEKSNEHGHKGEADAAERRVPLVSFCVPMYNGAAYLDDCLNGIVDQTFTDFEVLILDDCSNDDGRAIASRWVLQDERFKLHINEKNLGLVQNWNRCIELSKGRWIKFLFQDDVIEPDCLKRMLEAGNSGGGFVACSRAVIFEGLPDIKSKKWYDDHERFLERIYSGRARLSAAEYSQEKLSALELNIVGEPSVTLIRRDLFQRYGVFDPLLVQLCDSEMWNRLACNVGIDYVNEKLVSFRVHGKSATQANKSRSFRSGILDEIIELNRLCEASQLSGFRMYTRSVNQWRPLKMHLMRRTIWAFEQARLARRLSPTDESLTNDLHAVLPLLPGFTKSRLFYFLFSILRVLGRTKEIKAIFRMR